MTIDDLLQGDTDTRQGQVTIDLMDWLTDDEAGAGFPSAQGGDLHFRWLHHSGATFNAHRNWCAGRVFNAPTRLYRGEGRKELVDEIRYEDRPGSPFVLD